MSGWCKAGTRSSVRLRVSTDGLVGLYPDRLTLSHASHARDGVVLVLLFQKVGPSRGGGARQVSVKGQRCREICAFGGGRHDRHGVESSCERSPEKKSQLAYEVL